MLDQGGADHFADALDDIDHAGRNAGLQAELGHHDGGEGSLLGGLEHHAVAAGQGRDDGAGSRRGAVPGRDHGADADRPAHLLDDDVGRAGRHGAVQLGGPAGVVIHRVDAELDYEGRVGLDHAAIQDVQVGHQLAALADQGGEAAQPALLLLGVEIAPAAVVEGLARRANGPVDILRPARRAARELQARGRIVERHGLAGRGGDHLALDDVAELAQGEEVQRRLRQRQVVHGHLERSRHAHGLA